MRTIDQLEQEVRKNGVSLDGYRKMIENEICTDKAEIKRRVEEARLERERFQKVYGDKWFEMWARANGTWADDAHYRKNSNWVIYQGKLLYMCVHTHRPIKETTEYKIHEQRMREVYGERYEELKNHIGMRDDVTELLIQDAVRTKRWDELPEELQEECKRRMFVKGKR